MKSASTSTTEGSKCTRGGYRTRILSLTRWRKFYARSKMFRLNTSRISSCKWDRRCQLLQVASRRQATDRLEREYKKQFVEMSDMLALRRSQCQSNPMRGHAQRSNSSTTNTTTNTRRPLGITIPKGDGEQGRRRQDPNDPRCKRPVGQKK